MNERDFERREKARQDAMFDAQFADEPTSDVEYADEPPCKTGSQCTNKCQRCGEINPAEIHNCSPEPQINGWPLYSGLPMPDSIDDRFDQWWESEQMTSNNPYPDGGVLFWAWEGWIAALNFKDKT